MSTVSALKVSRRLLLAAPLAACAANMAPRPDLIRPFDPARQIALFPTDQSFLALYRRGGATLGWVAARHSADPNGPTARVVRDAFMRVRPRAVVLEGVASVRGKNPQRLKERLANLGPNEGNEGDLAARLAFAMGVDVWGGEPTEEELGARLVAKGFAAQDVLMSALFGPLEQMQREGAFAGPGDPRFALAFAELAADTARGYALGPAPTLREFQAWHQKAFAAPLVDAADWFQRGWPGEVGVAAQIARASNLERDLQAYAMTMERLESDRVVLVVYGASHLANVWDALSAAMGRPALVT